MVTTTFNKNNLISVLNGQWDDEKSVHISNETELVYFLASESSILYPITLLYTHQQSNNSISSRQPKSTVQRIVEIFCTFH